MLLVYGLFQKGRVLAQDAFARQYAIFFFAEHNGLQQNFGSLAEQLLKPAGEAYRERCRCIQVTSADGRTHLPWLGARRQPGVDLRPKDLLRRKLALGHRDGVDVALSPWPDGIGGGY